MKKCRWVSVLLAAVLLLAAARGETGFTDIRRILSATPAAWRESYETEWRQIDVDVPVTVPETDAVPILCVRLMPAPADELLSDWCDIAFNNPGALQANLRANDFLKSNERPRATRVFPGSERLDIIPENMTLTHAEAVSAALQLGSDLFSLPEGSLRLRSTAILDCVYTYRRAKGEIRFGKQVSRTGTYNLSFDQLFHGIPMRSGTSCYADYGNGMDPIFHTPSFGVVLDDTGCTKVRAALFEVAETVAEDVPLLPFDAAKDLFVREIMSGRLRTVDEVCFCYIPYQDAHDQSLLWLCPAWYLKGGYTRSAKKEFSPVIDSQTGEVIGDGMEHYELIVDAQSGKLLDYSATGKKRRVFSAFKTWSDFR